MLVVSKVMHWANQGQSSRHTHMLEKCSSDDQYMTRGVIIWHKHNCLTWCMVNIVTGILAVLLFCYSVKVFHMIYIYSIWYLYSIDI